MSVVHEKIQMLERKYNSVLEIYVIIEQICDSLRERINSKFVPLKVKTILTRLRKDGKYNICDDFMVRVQIVYENTLNYLEKWAESFSEFKVFSWIDFEGHNDLQYESLEETVKYLKKENCN